MMITLNGALEIDTDRGVMWFHCDEPKTAQVTMLRLCQLPKPIPDPRAYGMLDLTWMQSVNYRARPVLQGGVSHE